MSKKEKEEFISAMLSENVAIKGINCRVRIDDMFSRFSNAVVVLRKKNGALLAIGL